MTQISFLVGLGRRLTKDAVKCNGVFISPTLSTRESNLCNLRILNGLYPVSCPINNVAFAVGQLAVFQGASEAPISEFIRVERATQKNSQLATARRVAMKMGRRLSRGRGIGYVSI
jgi:hypothetical protein